MTAPIGFIVASDLGDGRVEPWETGSGWTVPMYASAEECRDVMDRYGASPDVWRVFALTEVDGGVS